MEHALKSRIATLKNNNNKMFIKKYECSTSRAALILDHCDNHLYYIDMANDKLYMKEEDIEKYNIDLNAYIDFKLSMMNKTNITMHQLWMIFIYYIK